MSGEFNQVTGTFMTRDIGVDEKSGRPNHRLVMVYGVLSIPENEVKSEHQYVADGSAHQDVITLNILTDRGYDRSKLSIGNTPTGMFHEEIWAV